MTWTCPSCGQEWPEKPLVDGTIGCPECGSIAATGVDPVAALAGWAAEDAEGRVMTIVEDPSFADWVPIVLARLSAAEQERDKSLAAIQSWRENYQANDQAKYDALDTAYRAEARAEAADKVMCEIETELRFRASTTNEFGQCDPPYTAHSLLSMADELAAALAGREETP